MTRPDPDAVTDEQFRAAGFTGAAREHPRTDLAFVMLCAWQGVSSDQAPPSWWFHPNDPSRQAWERVAEAARTHIVLEEL